MSEKRILLVDYDTRFIWLDGEVTQEMAYRFTRMLNKLNKLKTFPIIFYIRGIGGDAHAAFQMMNEMEDSVCPVATVAHDFVGSACFTLTQAGKHRLALAGTRFTFHLAVPSFEKPKEMPYSDQSEMVESLHRLRLIDAIQASWFLKRGRPAKEVFNLFSSGKRIGLNKAKKLKLIDDYYKKEDFLKDKRIINRILKAR